MECRANNSEKVPLLLNGSREEDNNQAYLSIIPKDVLEIILSELPHKDALNLAATSKVMNTRVNNARSPYTHQTNLKIVEYTYKQVMAVLKQPPIAKKRIEEIHDNNDESCYYVPPEDRQCTQLTETIVALFGCMTAGLSCGASVALSLTTPLIWPSLVCSIGSTAAACPIGLAATSRFYTHRFNREDKEIAALNEQIIEAEDLEKQISLKDAGKRK